MTMRIAKAGVDIGIVVRDAAAMLTFYRDVLGLYHEGDNPIPGGTMHRLWAAETMLKLVELDERPEAANPPGGLAGGTGIRYLTFSVSNMDEVHDACVAAGVTVVREPFTFVPGTRIALYEDPDANAVELLERTD